MPSAQFASTKSIVFRPVWLLPVALFLFVSPPSALLAQNSASGAISGVVQDSQGAVIPGAKVTAFNQDQNAINGVTTTNTAGVFVFDHLLAPATYTLTVEQGGFRKYAERNLVLGVNAQRGLAPFVLEVGSIQETVSVEANAIQLETVTAARSQAVTQQQIADLPVSGRSNIATAYLREVNGNPPDATGNMNGQPSVQQTVTMDGVTFMDMGNAGANFGSSVEAIGEVKVSTN